MITVNFYDNIVGRTMGGRNEVDLREVALSLYVN